MAIYTLRQRSLLLANNGGADMEGLGLTNGGGDVNGIGLGGPLQWTYYPRLLAVICHLLFEVIGASLLASLFLDIQGSSCLDDVLSDYHLAGCI
eukprot:scaffold978_cov172-Ochromonas_danica.AAC.8